MFNWNARGKVKTIYLIGECEEKEQILKDMKFNTLLLLPKHRLSALCQRSVRVDSNFYHILLFLKSIPPLGKKKKNLTIATTA